MLNGFLRITGSKIEVNKEEVANMHKAKETFENFILPKNVTQCMATIPPVKATRIPCLNLMVFIPVQKRGKKASLALQ